MIAVKAINIHEKIRNFQNTAKVDQKRKFYAMYNKTYRKDILEEAWKRAKQNGGAGGVDKVSIDDVKAYGAEKLLDEIAEELRTEKYQCKPVRRTYIPKVDGRKRALGILTIKEKQAMDRIFEVADKGGALGIIDADIRDYFGSRNHDKLLLLVEQRIIDRKVLKLIKGWHK